MKTMVSSRKRLHVTRIAILALQSLEKLSCYRSIRISGITRFSLLLVFLSAVVAVCIAPNAVPAALAQGASVMIHGYIRDEAGGPVQMTVTVDAFDLGNQGWVRSDANGYYEKQVPEATQYIVTAEPGPAEHIGMYSFPTGYLLEKKLVTKVGSDIRVDFAVHDGGAIWLQAYDEFGNEMFRQDFLEPRMFGAFPPAVFPCVESIQAEYGGIPLFWGWIQGSDKNTACLLLPPGESAVIWGPWRLPEIGTTFLHADNDGNGFSVQGWDVVPINLVYEFARTEYRETSQRYQEFAEMGYLFSEQISRWLAEAQQNLASADSCQEQGLKKDAATYSYTVLKDVVQAREQTILEKAQQDIERFRKADVTIAFAHDDGQRIPNAIVEYEQVSHDFIFSVGWPFSHQYATLRDAGFAYANFETWWGEIEMSDGVYHFPDAEAQALTDAGFGLAMLSSIWTTTAYDRATPRFTAGMSPPELNLQAYEYSHDIVAHYVDELRIYNVFNEPDMPQAFNFTLDEHVDIVDASACGAKDANPNLPLFVNIGAPIFGRYALDPVNYLVAYDMYGNMCPETPIFPPAAHSGYDFVRAMIEANVDCDTIGLECYYGVTYPPIDLGLLSDMLDVYGALGKPIYVSELSYATLDDYPGLTKPWSKYGGWHEGYTDEAQADWAEYAMTVIFSRLYASGVQWVGAQDGPPEYDFIGDGLFHKDGSTPRPIVGAIEDLIQSWTTSGTGTTDETGCLSFRGFAGHYMATITTSDGRHLEQEFDVTNKPAVDLAKVADPVTLPEPGGVFTFTLKITSNSVEPVTVIDLTDTDTLSVECLALVGTTIPAGGSVSCTCDVTHTEAGSYNNTASVTVRDNEGNTASDSDNETVTVTLVPEEPDTGPEEPDTGCFIASAAWGTPLAAETQVLRKFRNEYLLSNPMGQALADLYYLVSPPIAEFISEHPGLKPLVRTGLMPVVTVTGIVASTSPAEKTVVIGLLVLVSVAVALCMTRRRSECQEQI